jgi:hypothetical protein
MEKPVSKVHEADLIDATFMGEITTKWYTDRMAMLEELAELGFSTGPALTELCDVYLKACKNIEEGRHEDTGGSIN